MASENLEVFSWEDIKGCTNNFNKKNQVGLVEFAKVYRGTIDWGMTETEARDVTVKIWDKSSEYIAFTYDEYLTAKASLELEEVEFLTHPTMKGHPNLPRLVGYCFEEVKGVVYDFSARGTLRKLMVEDDLNWLQRMNIILELARLLKFLHCQETPYLVFNVNASHILLDWDFKPKLIDFGLVSNGVMGEMCSKKKQTTLLTRSVDPHFTLRGGAWDTSCEVFSFGIILLGLIAKGSPDVEERENPDVMLDRLLQAWAKVEYKPKCSLVDKSLQEDWDYHTEDGTAITELVMRCIEFFPRNRPTIEDVVERLERLHIFQRLGDRRPRKRDKKFHDDPMCM